MTLPPLTISPKRLSPEHVLLRCASTRPEPLGQVVGRARKRYPELGYLGREDQDVPNHLRWRWDKLLNDQFIRKDGAAGYVLTGSGEAWLSDFWRREVVEPYLKDVAQTFGLDVLRAELPTLDSDVQRVAAKALARAGEVINMPRRHPGNPDFYAGFVQVLPDVAGPVTITGPGHAHHGCEGEIEGGAQSLAGVDTPMYRVRLTRCPHGLQACFAVREDLTPRRAPGQRKAVFASAPRVSQPPQPPPPDIPVEVALERWLQECREIRARNNTERFQVKDIGLMPTRSDFFKVVQLEDSEPVSAFAFIARWNGENRGLRPFWTGHIYMPDTWSRPAKHSRGTVWAPAAAALSERGYTVRTLR